LKLVYNFLDESDILMQTPDELKNDDQIRN